MSKPRRRGPGIVLCSSAALAFLLATSGPSSSQDSVRERNALSDIAREQARQSEFMRRADQRASERSWREENRYVNEKRDARSMRRFDR